jgi:hypothetical protein
MPKLNRGKPFHGNSLFNELTKAIPDGMWVALSSDKKRLLSYGNFLKEVMKEAAKKGEENPVFARIRRDLYRK